MTNKLPGYLDIPDLTSEAAAFAAKWWADTIRNAVGWDNGDVMCNAFAGMLQESSRKNITPEIVDMFEKTLLGEMLEPKKLDNHETGNCAPKKGCIGYGRSHQSIDYHPGGVLRDALDLLEEMPPGTSDDVVQAWKKAVRSLENLLPCKTNVNISCAAVATSLGYGNSAKVSWKAYERVETEVSATREDRYKVVDRYMPQTGHDAPAGWLHGGEQPGARLFFVSLDPELARPVIALYRIRGIVNANLYNDVEDPIRLAGSLAYAMSNAVGNGYLALAVER